MMNSGRYLPRDEAKTDSMYRDIYLGSGGEVGLENVKGGYNNNYQIDKEVIFSSVLNF